jgi:ArsR family transcriptional regulator
MNYAREALLLLLVAVAPALLAVAIHPQLRDRARAGLYPEAVRLAEVRNWKSDVLWIDARPEEEFAIDHIPGAINLELANFDQGLGRVLETWQPGLPIVAYCSSSSCEASREMAHRLTESGLVGVHYLHGGWETWIAATK